MTKTTPAFSENDKNDQTPVDKVDAKKDATPDVKASSPEESSVDFVYVSNGDGTFDRVARSEVEARLASRPATAKQSRQYEPEPIKEPDEFYVHLADGSVERVAEPDLPTVAGSNAPNGHWERDGKVYVVTAIYPAETVVEGK
jgi:hypothetical protein